VVRQFLKAFEIDPRDHELPGNIAIFLYDLEMIEEGDEFRDLVLAVAPTSEIAYQVELRRAIMTGDADASIASARRAIEDDVSDRRNAFRSAVQLLMRTAASNGTVDETTAYLEQHAPGLFDTSADSVPQKFREAQIAAFESWYVALPREELLRRLDDVIQAALDFGVDPLEDPGVRMGVHALRGETDDAIETALEYVLSQPVTTDLRWRENYSQALYADIVADERVREALQRWEQEYIELREKVRSYLSDLSVAA